MKYLAILLIAIILIYQSSKFNLAWHWQDNKVTKTITLNYDEAVKYCEDLSYYLKDDWRLPTIKELQSIVDIAAKNRPPIKSRFKNIAIKGKYWSITPFAWDDVSYAWSLDFYDGDITWQYKYEKLYVRCIRGEVER